MNRAPASVSAASRRWPLRRCCAVRRLPVAYPAVVLHPGHICGPGWPVITPAGNFDADVWRRLAVGEAVALPALGPGVLHHVHADDVAQAFERAVTQRAAIGAGFHVVAEQAMTCRGLAEGVAAWFAREAVLDLVEWGEFERRVGSEHASATLDHIERSISRPTSRASEAWPRCRRPGAGWRRGRPHPCRAARRGRGAEGRSSSFGAAALYCTGFRYVARTRPVVCRWTVLANVVPRRRRRECPSSAPPGDTGEGHTAIPSPDVVSR